MSDSLSPEGDLFGAAESNRNSVSRVMGGGWVNRQRNRKIWQESILPLDRN